MTIFTVASDAYVPFACALAQSIRENSPTERFHLVAVNISDPRLDAMSHSQWCTVEHEWIETSTLSGSGKYGRIPTYCMRKKFSLIPRMMKKYNGETVMWIDADSLVRRSVAGLFMKACVLPVMARMRDDGVWRAALQIFNTRHPEAWRFAATYCKLGRRTTTYKADQQQWLTAMELHPEIAIGALDECYCDVTFQDDSPIWTAKIRQHNDRKWVAEYRRYYSAFMRAVC